MLGLYSYSTRFKVGIINQLANQLKTYKSNVSVGVTDQTGNRSLYRG
jgi:hypothetical protein